jgi:2',3'-cyclic-nucleotide 2'-phosphodiesterase (5'-nucleotidase family)
VTRRFLVALILSGVLCAADHLKPLTIIHTNDLHARLTPMADGRSGFAHLATAIRKEKEGCAHCIVLNCGDLVQGTPVSSLYKGIPVFEIANYLGFDAATLGNHEFDYGHSFVRDYLRIARYPIVSANIVDGDGKLFLVKPYTILTAGGLRVAVVGAMTTELYRLQIPSVLGNIRATPVSEAVKRYLPEVRAKSDVVILLGHLSPEDEEDVRLNLQEVQVLIGGHIHAGLKELAHFGQQWQARVQANGVELGRLDLQVDPARKRVVSASWKRIPVDSRTFPADPVVAKLVAEWEGKVTAMMDVPIGEAKRTLQKADLKRMIERALCEQMGADLAFMGYGGIRDILPQGTILVRHIWNIFPFDNVVVMGKFRGSRLPPTVTQGKQIDPQKEYTLATNEFAAANQSSPRELNTSGLEFPITGPLQRDLLIEWVKKVKVIE